MNAGMKMMLATRARDNDDRRSDGVERKDPRNNYPEGDRPENRYPSWIYPRYDKGDDHRQNEDRRGPRMEHNDEMEDRFRDRRGREHYDNGRFAPARSEGDRTISAHMEPYYPYVPPVRQEMAPIGFSVQGEMENVVPFSPRNHEGKKLDRETAEEWAEKMENKDGTKGPHWTFDQVKQVMSQKGIDADPAEFYLALNMMYSDYCKLAKKMNVNTMDFYSGMAMAFLDDKDAGEDKLMRYFRYVVK